VCSDITTALASLSHDDRQDESISHALRLKTAWALGDYRLFFKLYQNAPKMAGHLIDWFVERERKNAMKAIVKAYVYIVFLELCSKSHVSGPFSELLVFSIHCILFYPARQNNSQIFIQIQQTFSIIHSPRLFPFPFLYLFTS
jgi:hypothetical protein